MKLAAIVAVLALTALICLVYLTVFKGSLLVAGIAYLIFATLTILVLWVGWPTPENLD